MSSKIDAQLDRIESKVDRLDDRQDRMELQIQKNTIDLEIHIKRNDNFEKALQPVLAHMTFLDNAKKLVVTMAKVSGWTTGTLATLFGLAKVVGLL